MSVDYLSNVISALVIKKLLKKGYEVYLVIVTNLVSPKLTISDIRTVRDFSDAFSNELSGMASTREVEFGIDLIPGTTPMSIASYRMTPKELAKLKA